MLEVRGKVSLDGSGFTRTLNALGQQADSLKGRLAGAFSAAAITAALNTLIDFGGQIKDTQERINTTAESVQQLMLAAKLGGGDINEVAAAYDRLGKAIESARSGNKEMAGVLAALGASADDINSQNVDRVFRSIAGSIDSIAGNSESAAALMEVFGKSGGKLVPIMKELDALKDKQSFLSQDDVDRLDAIGDHFTKLGHNLKEVYGSLVATLIGAPLQFLTGGKSPAPTRRAALNLGNSEAEKAKAKEREIAAQAHMSTQDRILQLEKEAAEIFERNRIKRLTSEQREVELLKEKAVLMEKLHVSMTAFPGTEPGEGDAEMSKRLAEIDSELLGIGKDRARGQVTPLSDSLSRIGGFTGTSGDPQTAAVKEMSTEVKAARGHLEAIRRRLEKLELE